MQKQEIFDFINSNPVLYIATAEGDQPCVRAIALYKADESGILFHTGPVKDFYRQLVANPNVQICVYNQEQNIQVRVRGKVERVEDIALKDEIANHPSRTFMQKWKANCANPEDFYQMFSVFRLSDGIANVWTFESNFAPKQDVAL